MAEPQSCLVLPELPKFTGYTGEDFSVKPDIDPKDFIRAIENYFECNKIKDDGHKLRVFYAQIDKKIGNGTNKMNQEELARETFRCTSTSFSTIF